MNLKSKIKTMKTIELYDLLELIDSVEARKEISKYLPSGFTDPVSKRLSERIYDLILDRDYGNQRFQRDSFHLFWFKSVNNEPFDNKEEEFLFNFCTDVIDEDMILFKT